MTPLELLDVLSGYTFSRNILKRLPSFVLSTSIFAKARGTTCKQFQNRPSLQTVLEPAGRFWNRLTGSGTV